MGRSLRRSRLPALQHVVAETAASRASAKQATRDRLVWLNSAVIVSDRLSHKKGFQMKRFAPMALTTALLAVGGFSARICMDRPRAFDPCKVSKSAKL